MSPSQDVCFSPQSDCSATRACVDVLLIIGRAMRMYFPHLRDACDGDPDHSPRWDDVLRVLADILFREMRAKHINHITHALDLWKEFEACLTVQRLTPAGKKALKKAGEKIVTDAVAANAGAGMSILWTANLKAAAWIEQHIVAHLEQTRFATARLVIDLDEAGTQFCASSSSLGGEIHWTLQPFEHSLYGAMVLSRILEHVSQWLSKGVREVFLVETLEEEHRNDTELGPRDTDAEMKLAGWFRLKLEEHFCRNQQMSRAGLRDFEEVAVRIRRRSVLDFWKMTAEILSLPDGEAKAREVDKVLKTLRTRQDEIVDKLTVPWKSFAECLEMAEVILNI